MTDQDIQDLLPPAPPPGEDSQEEDVDNDENSQEGDLSLPSPRQKSRPGLKRRSSMEMGSKLRKQIVQDSQMLIAKEAMKIRNIASGGSEDWGKAWDEDDDAGKDRNGKVEEVSRMQRTLKVSHFGRRSTFYPHK